MGARVQAQHGKRLLFVATSDDTRIVLLRFLAVGGTLVLVHIGLATLFAVAFLIPPAIANVSAHALCLPPTYLAQRRVAFRSDAPHARAFWRYAGLQLPLIGLGGALAWLLIGQMGLHAALAFVLICPFVALVSFAAQRWWAFARR
jgi:putative flippase GtrA